VEGLSSARLVQLAEEQPQFPPHPPQPPPPLENSPAELSDEALRLANVEKTARVLVLSQLGQTWTAVRVE
jgi:hypothetical protein